MNEEANVGVANYEGGEYQQEYSEPQQEPVGSPEPSPTTSDGSPSTFAIRVDPRSGRRQIVSVGSEEAEPAYPQMAQPQRDEIRMPLNIPQNTEPQQNYANAKEVIDAMNAGTLDENRIPVEMAFQYAQFKQGVQQQQTINNQQKIEQSQPQPSVTPEMAQARQEFFGRVDSMAKENALKDIGLTEDELITAEYSDDPEIQAKAQMYETALSMHRNNIIQAVQRERQNQINAELAQRAVITNVNAKINELSRTEPQFKPIMESMGTFFKDKSIPFDDGVRYLLAMNAYNSGNMTEQQANDMQEYWNLARKAHYMRTNGIGQRRPHSPYVEGPANSSNMQNSGTDRANLLKQLRSATDYRVKRQLMGQLLGK